MSKIVCGCSAVVERINDGKSDEILGCCLFCLKNNGDWTKSPHWKQDPEPTPVKKEDDDEYEPAEPRRKKYRR